MKVVKFKGGLGNQLFQYAFLRALKLKYNCKNVKGDFSYFSDLKNDSIRVPRIDSFNIKIEKANNIDLSQVNLFKHQGNPLCLVYKLLIYIETLLNKRYFFEKDRGYRNLEQLTNHEYFDGYWQSWRYIEGIEGTLRRELILKSNLSKKTSDILRKIKNENSVFVGIRRGDYLATAKARKHFGSFGIEYYQCAIDYIKERTESPIFYIFSNDIQWVKQNMIFNCNVIFRDDEETTSDTEELTIMAACKHAIIVNSTFYWWGAWLINNPNKIVIAPRKWFADEKPIDIVPDSWVKM